MILAAPKLRANSIEKSPTGPQPKIATLCPRISTIVAAWIALPNGSYMAAISGRRRVVSTAHRFLAGILAYSAKIPSIVMPRIASFRQTLIATAAGDVRVARHQRADLNLGAIFWVMVAVQSLDHGTLLHNLAEKFVSSDAAGFAFVRQRLVHHLLKSGPIPEISVRPAHAGVAQFDYYRKRVFGILLFIQFRLRNIHHLKPPRSIPGLFYFVIDKGFHVYCFLFRFVYTGSVSAGRQSLSAL